ncbi:MAG: inositol monophosphatase family protein [Opitutales bacterium]
MPGKSPRSRRGKPLRPGSDAFATALRHRQNAGRHAVLEQVPFFRQQFANVPSEWKADDTRVTFADFAISEKIFDELRRSFPDDDFCSEESSPLDELRALSADFAWVLDPIDGTNNYFLGIPYCAISLALLYEGVPIYGIIYDFSRDTLLHGGPDHGLFEGKRKRRALDASLGRDTIIGLHFKLDADLYDKLRPLLTTYRARCLGSAALMLAYAAAGLIDGVIDHRVKVWDIAAGHALMAGGGGQFHFMREPCFPLHDFHVDQPRTPYYAGSPAFCSYVADLLAEKKQ